MRSLFRFSRYSQLNHGQDSAFEADFTRTSGPANMPSPIRFILDTDMGGGACRDVDDVVALCISHALMDNGEAELLAVVQDTAPRFDMFNHLIKFNH